MSRTPTSTPRGDSGSLPLGREQEEEQQEGAGRARAGCGAAAAAGPRPTPTPAPAPTWAGSAHAGWLPGSAARPITHLHGCRATGQRWNTSAARAQDHVLAAPGLSLEVVGRCRLFSPLTPLTRSPAPSPQPRRLRPDPPWDQWFGRQGTSGRSQRPHFGEVILPGGRDICLRQGGGRGTRGRWERKGSKVTSL